MKSILSRLLIAAATVLLGTALMQSQSADDTASPPPAMHGHGHEFMGPMGFFAKNLDLSDAQKAQMKTILQKERPTTRPLFQQSRQIEQQLRQYEQGSYDEAKVRTLAMQQSQIQTELTVQRTRIHSELFQVLTPEQQAKMKEFEARRAARIQARDQPPPPASPDQE